MELFATDLDRLGFLLETDAALGLHLESLAAQGVDLVTEELPPDQRPKYVTNYIGSKQKLVDWIWKHTPDDVESVADAFSGSAAVAYMYKTKGLRVLANDRLRYCYHAARAIVENSDTRFTESDLDKLLAHNPKARTFVRDTFKGIFFAQGVHGLIDNIRANCDQFKGYKRDIALFALGKTCMSGKGGFGHFSSSTQYGKREDSPDEFIERLRGNVARINALVFDGGKPCKASHEDVNVFLPKADVDLAYFDPPYATEFSTTNYERSYHFVEGLMTYWDGLEINEDSKVKFYETDHETVTKANAKGFFETFLGNATHIPHWLISYRDHAYQHARHVATAQGIQAILKLACSLAGIDGDHIEWDARPWFLNCPNGTVDLLTGELLPHDRGHYLTKMCPVEYDPAAQAPRWERFLEEVFAGDAELIDYIQWGLGYALTGATDYHCFFVMHGSGSNGKSTLVSTVQHVMGADYAQQLDPEELMLQKNARHSTELAQLRGARFG